MKVLTHFNKCLCWQWKPAGQRPSLCSGSQGPRPSSSIQLLPLGCFPKDVFIHNNDHCADFSDEDHHVPESSFKIIQDGFPAPCSSLANLKLGERSRNSRSLHDFITGSLFKLLSGLKIPHFSRIPNKKAKSYLDGSAVSILYYVTAFLVVSLLDPFYVPHLVLPFFLIFNIFCLVHLQ